MSSYAWVIIFAHAEDTAQPKQLFTRLMLVNMCAHDEYNFTHNYNLDYHNMSQLICKEHACIHM